MAIRLQQEFMQQGALLVAQDMANAARTAPKAIGLDRLTIAVVDGPELAQLARHMHQMHLEGRAAAHFARDADNLCNSLCCVLIGTETGPRPTGCAACGMTDCASHKGFAGGTPCAYALHDLGVAVGSAVSLAADRRVDNRVMYSVGAAAVDLGWLGASRVAMGIPLSTTGKSIFFDRKV